MRYLVNINQSFCLQHGLTAKEGAIMDVLNQLSSWADSIHLEGETFYNITFRKINEELPLFFNDVDRVYRLMKNLEKSGFLEQRKVGQKKKNYVRLTKKGKGWNKYLGVGKNPETNSVSGKIPSENREKSRNPKNVNSSDYQDDKNSVSGKIPTNNIYINNTSINTQRACAREVDLELKNYAKHVGSFFGKTTEVQLMKVHGFLIGQVKENLPEFKKQFEAYKRYKKISGEKIHRFENFCSEWNQQNWQLLLSNLQFQASQQPQASNQPQQPYRKVID